MLARGLLAARCSLRASRCRPLLLAAWSSMAKSPVPALMLSSRGVASLVGPHLFEKVLSHPPTAVALTDAAPISESMSADWTYAQLVREAFRVRDEVRSALGREAEPQSRVAFLGSRGASYVAIQWGIWLAGAVAVPLHPSHPRDELDYILSDSGASLLVASEVFTSADSTLADYVHDLPSRVGVPVHVHHLAAEDSSPESKINPAAVDELREWVEGRDLTNQGAYMIYTSGTTGRPKGVLTTHANLTAQIHDIVAAWEMTPQDHLMHFLPLHHVHGVVNNLLCVLYAGGSVDFLPSASTELIWRKLAEGSHSSRPITMLMAVPTVYMKLLETMETMQKASKESGGDNKIPQQALEGARNLRVAVSGSMACPVSILSRWEELTGLRLLERYGMTELGMVLTNPLHGERHLGYVGNTFPSVTVRLVDTETEEELPHEDELEGELRVKGPTVFREYWNKPEATAKEFDADGWFKTGDIAQYSNEFQSFRIRGRASADILKSAGYKISALDVERVLLTHPEVRECAVFGLPDETWGQVVSAVVRVSDDPTQYRPGSFVPPLDEFMRDHLADYRVPRKYFFVNEIPKNAMGKVNKKALAKFFAEQSK